MKTLRYAVLVVLTAIFISPLVFMVVTSFKSVREAVQTPPTWVPPSPPCWGPPSLCASRCLQLCS